ncbi:MAG: hypothetical protein QM767_11390 [Anaeromyxobacter sp.]
MIVCGLWAARRHLVAVLVGDRGEPRRTVRAAGTDDARFGLLEYLAHAGAELVATAALAQANPLLAQAARRGIAVWILDDQLAAALLAAAGIRDPVRAAALLARLRIVPAWRAHLRPLTPAMPARQLPLL